MSYGKVEIPLFHQSEWKELQKDYGDIHLF
jgi:hypothetical protein